MGLSGVTRSGRVFASPDLPIQPTNVKGKAKVVEEQDDKTPLTPNEDIPVKGLPEKKGWLWQEGGVARRSQRISLHNSAERVQGY